MNPSFFFIAPLRERKHTSLGFIGDVDVCASQYEVLG
ncbi:MAG: hypothetical protein ACI81P_001177 [Neolewinella sp.]|jgi:hypothetical protein